MSIIMRELNFATISIVELSISEECFLYIIYNVCDFSFYQTYLIFAFKYLLKFYIFSVYFFSSKALHKFILTSFVTFRIMIFFYPSYSIALLNCLNLNFWLKVPLLPRLLFDHFSLPFFPSFYFFLKFASFLSVYFLIILNVKLKFCFLSFSKNACLYYTLKGKTGFY